MIPQQLNESPNLLEAYRIDPMIREKCNDKGLYANFGEGVTLTLYLTEGIEDSSQYHEFSETAAALTPEDTIVLMINNGGGYLSGAQMISRVLMNCPAYSIGIVVDMAASAATIVALQVDELVMEPFSYFMIHAPTWGEYPKKMHELQASAEFAIPHTKSYIASVYKDFLTDDEITHVINGGDKYLTAEEVMERFANIQERRTMASLEQQQEHIKEHIQGLEAQLNQMKSMVKPEDKPKATKKVTKAKE